MSSKEILDFNMKLINSNIITDIKTLHNEYFDKYFIDIKEQRKIKLERINAINI